MIPILPSLSDAKFIPLFDGIAEEPYTVIEQAGRTCYKSENKITINSAKKFVSIMGRSGHYSVIEHSNLIVKIIYDDTFVLSDLNSKFLNVDENEYGIFVGGNIRAWSEAIQFKIQDLPLTELVRQLKDNWRFEIITKMNTVPKSLLRFGCRIIHDRAFTHELVRHRVLSFSQMSQRYVEPKNIEFIIPEDITDIESITVYTNLCRQAQFAYNKLRAAGIKKENARSVLPNMIKTEIYTSGDVAGWEHFFTLRDHSAAHPDMRRMAKIIRNEYNKQLLKI